MENASTPRTDYNAAVAAWWERARWFRRLMARAGIEGKLVVAFTSLLAIAMVLCCWAFVSKSESDIEELLGEQAKQLATTLALTARDSVTTRSSADLRATGNSLVKSRNILYVIFLDTDYKLISSSHRDPDFVWAGLAADQRRAEILCRVRPQYSDVFAEYLEVLAPVISAESGPAGRLQSRLVGYVAVGMSQQEKHIQTERMKMVVIGIGSIMALLSLPLSYLAVRRIFVPIRQLVVATGEIAGGRLDTRVAIDRPDVIGELARSFNDMVIRVKQQQQDLEEANAELERKVRQRTGELESANDRLRREIAEKEDFMRAISHDLNAPLRNISGMASMLLVKHRQHFDDDVIHRLERINKNVEVETNLIGELLELSRIKTRRQKMEPIETDALVRELAGVFEQDLQSRSIELIVDNQLPVLTCEKARIRQVFQNLIDNAIKYMGDGEVREIHIGSKLTPESASFYVRDMGIGIEKDDIDTVFNVFRRGKSAVVQSISGKGVGLASVKSIIETYEGAIQVESEVGKGSRFVFTIHGKYVPALARDDMAMGAATSVRSKTTV